MHIRIDYKNDWNFSSTEIILFWHRVDHGFGGFRSIWRIFTRAIITMITIEIIDFRAGALENQIPNICSLTSGLNIFCLWEKYSQKGIDASKHAISVLFLQIVNVQKNYLFTARLSNRLYFE